MSDRRHVQALMREIGPGLELQEVTEFEERGTWTLVVDDGTVLFADYDDGREGIVLSAEVALPPEAGRPALHEFMLRYNNAWRETGGVRLALDGEGAVVQLFDVPAAGLDLSRLQGVVAGFVGTLRAWREIVARGGARGQEDAEAAPVNPMLLAGMIRG